MTPADLRAMLTADPRLPPEPRVVELLLELWDIAIEKGGEPHSEGCRYLNPARGCTCCKVDLQAALAALEAHAEPGAERHGKEKAI